MRRSKQQLDEAACQKVLDETEFGSLAVIDENGYPYTFSMHHLYADGKIYFHSAKVGKRVDALKECNKVTFNVVDSGWHDDDDYWHYQSVISFGRINIVEDRELHYRILQKLCEKSFTPEKTKNEMRGAEAVIVLEMEIEHMTGKAIKF